VIDKEIERGGIPVAFITPMASLAKQMGAKRIITGIRIPHPCGDPSVSEEADRALRREIVNCALEAIQTDIDAPTIFEPNVTFH
jgi:betaine reductase